MITCSAAAPAMQRFKKSRAQSTSAPASANQQTKAFASFASLSFDLLRAVFSFADNRDFCVLASTSKGLNTAAQSPGCLTELDIGFANGVLCFHGVGEGKHAKRWYPGLDALNATMCAACYSRCLFIHNRARHAQPLILRMGGRLEASCRPRVERIRELEALWVSADSLAWLTSMKALETLHVEGTDNTFIKFLPLLPGLTKLNFCAQESRVNVQDLIAGLKAIPAEHCALRCLHVPFYGFEDKGIALLRSTNIPLTELAVCCNFSDAGAEMLSALPLQTLMLYWYALEYDEDEQDEPVRTLAFLFHLSRCPLTHLDLYKIRLRLPALPASTSVRPGDPQQPSRDQQSEQQTLVMFARLEQMIILSSDVFQFIEAPRLTTLRLEVSEQKHASHIAMRYFPALTTLDARPPADCGVPTRDAIAHDILWAITAYRIKHFQTLTLALAPEMVPQVGQLPFVSSLNVFLANGAKAHTFLKKLATVQTLRHRLTPIRVTGFHVVDANADEKTLRQDYATAMPFLQSLTLHHRARVSLQALRKMWPSLRTLALVNDRGRRNEPVDVSSRVYICPTAAAGAVGGRFAELMSYGEY